MDMVLIELFANAADYDLVQEKDRVSIQGLTDLAPGSAISIVLKHEDGSEDTVPATHTLSDAQVEWFKAGSALNAMKAR